MVLRCGYMAIGPRAARVRQVCELMHRTNIAGAWDNDSANKDMQRHYSDTLSFKNTK